MLHNCPVAGDDLGRGWTGRESPAIERVGGERGGGIERRLGAREVTGTQSISLLFSLVQEDYPIKQFSLWGKEKRKGKKKDSYSLTFLGIPAEGTWQLVVLLLTCIAVNNAFSSFS